MITTSIIKELRPRLIKPRFVCGIFSHIKLDILRYVCLRSAIFWQIQEYSESWHSQTYSCILRYIQNSWPIQPYSEPVTYLARSRYYSRAIHAYSGPYLSRFRHIYHSGLFGHVMFHAYSGIFTKVHISRYICPPSDSDIFRILALPIQKHVKQHLLFKLGFSFKSLFRSVWNIF